MPNNYISRDALLAALTNTHEKEVDSFLFGGKVLIREITARQRMLAQQAAQAEDGENPDNALYQAMLVQMAVVDPESGTPGPDGRIDPRTRAPLLTIDDVRNLSDGRFTAMSQLVEAIQELAGLGPQAMFSSNQTADGTKRGAGAGTKRVGEAADEATSEGVGDDGGGGALASGDGEGDRAEPE